MNIEPIKLLNNVATQMECGAINVYPAKGYADTVWRLLDENGVELLSRYLRIDEDDYAKWGTDDSYIINLIAEKVGVIIDDKPGKEESK